MNSTTLLIIVVTVLLVVGGLYGPAAGIKRYKRRSS